MRYLLIIICLLAATQSWALDNLDQLEIRTARKSTATFYSGAVSGNSYVYQPQTVVFTNASTNRQVTLMTQTPNQYAGYNGTEYGQLPWSADGKRMAISINRDVENYTRSTYSTAYPWFTLRSDGSYMRPISELPWRSTQYTPYFNWSRATPDTSYNLGRNYDGLSGKDGNRLYKGTITDTGATVADVVDLDSGNTTTWLNGMKGAISSDDKYMVISASTAESETSPYHFVDLTTGTVATEWTLADLSLDTYWTGTSTSEHLHDEYLIGNSVTGHRLDFYWAAPNSMHWIAGIFGSDNGIPTHTQDHAAPYDWFSGTAAQTEVKLYRSAVGGTEAWTDADLGYWSHHSWDAWGRYVAYHNGDQMCPTWGTGPTVDDTKLNAATGKPYGKKVDYCHAGGAYVAWGGFTDYVATMSTGPTGVANQVATFNIQGTNAYKVANLHSRTTGDFAQPGQSPDGTKFMVKSDWLNPTAGNANIFVAVAYNPHPPFVRAVSATGGTVSVNVDWDLAGTPRGYTTRGWPNEDTDLPPPPREIKEFRLWRSTNGTTWAPVKTFTHDIWTHYDFSDGTYDGDPNDDNWIVTDTPGNGTFYYAVTSVEHSGLESRTLSNVYSVTIPDGIGSQSATYPADPKGASSFFTTAPDNPVDPAYTYKKSPATADGQYTVEWTAPTNKTLIRYYNVYAADDGATPTATQQYRIASIPATAADTSFKYIDWLGKTNGTTKYLVTAVDYQGNESGADAPAEGDAIPPTLIANPGTSRNANAVAVSLTASETATIYYTTDGTTPTESSAQYSSPVAMKPGKQLQAFAKDTAGNVGPVIIADYGWPRVCR